MGFPEKIYQAATPAIFVGWYNGHPDYRDYNLTEQRHPSRCDQRQCRDGCRACDWTVCATLEKTDIAEYASMSCEKVR
jgi:hypothetical protein